MEFVLQEFDAGATFAKLSSELNRDPDNVESFVKNPIGFLTRDVGLTFTGASVDIQRRLAGLSRGQISKANAFVHTLLANPGFVDWMRSYNGEMASQAMSIDLTTEAGRDFKRKILEDFARAMIDYGELPLFIDLIKSGSDRGMERSLLDDPTMSVAAWYDGVAVDVETFIVSVAVGLVVVALIGVAFQIDLTIPVGVPEAQRVSITANEFRNLAQQMVDYAQSIHGRSGDA